MGVRRVRRQQRQHDMRVSRIENGMRKRDERARRDQRMRELIQKGQFPYTPPIMSWLSVQLDKPSTRITPEDVQRLMQSSSSG